MLKIELYTKTILLMIFCTWTFMPLEYINNTLHENSKFYQGINYSTSDIIIMGGSNSMLGIRAEKIQYNTKNISVNSEMGNFNTYLSFVKVKINEPKIIIYSSLDFWNYSDMSSLPKTSITSFVYRLFRNDQNVNVNAYGDYLPKNYKCIGVGVGVGNKPIKISKNNNDFIKRIKTIKSLYKNSRIIVRIPPLFVEDERAKEKLLNYMLFSIQQMKQENIEVFVHSNTLYNNKNLACSDAYHPNYAHSLILSEELNKYLQQ